MHHSLFSTGDKSLFRQLSPCRVGGLCEHGAVPKGLIRGVIKAVAGIAAVVFFLARMTTNTGLLLFVGSIVVPLICFGLLKLLENEYENTGYWPNDHFCSDWDIAF